MDPVNLWRCERCGLTWVAGTERIEGVCGQCRQQHSTPQADVVLAGKNVPVLALMSHGIREAIGVRLVARGLDRLDLADRCGHGYISASLCFECQDNYSASMLDTEVALR
jgi:hypothetical protein